eukprot:gene4722-5776_t
MAHLSDTISSAEETCDDEQPMAECRQDTDASSTVSSNFGWDFNDDADTPLVLDEYELYEVHPDGIFEELQLRHVHPIITSPLNLVSVSTLEYPGHMVEFINREITYGKVRFPFMREGTHYQMVDNLDRGLASGETFNVTCWTTLSWWGLTAFFVIIEEFSISAKLFYGACPGLLLGNGRWSLVCTSTPSRAKHFGYLYKVDVVDDWGRWVWVAFMKKSEYRQHFQRPSTIQRVDYLLNWLPKTALNFDTPYHRVQGRTAPDLSHLWVFGCEIFFPGPDLRAHKLEPRAAIGRYVGHSEESASYLLLDEETGQIANAGVEYYEALGIPVNTYYPLLTEGDKESYGVDYGEVLAPCTQISSVCLVFVLSLAYQLQVHHVNVETAFLNSPLQEELYVEREGCYYAKSIKSLYGHKQAGKTWFDTSEASILAYDSHLKKSV